MFALILATVVDSAGRPERLQDPLTSQLEGACADTQQAGDVVRMGVLEEHRDDRPIAVLHLVQQNVDLTRLKVRELLLSRGHTPDDADLLLRIRIAPEDAVGAGNGRGTGQVLIHSISEDQHTGRVDEALHPGGQGQCLAVAECGRDQARTWSESCGECQCHGAAARGAAYPDASLPTKQRPDAVSRRRMIVHDQQIDLVPAACIVAIAAVRSLTFKLSLGGLIDVELMAARFPLRLDSPYNVASDGLLVDGVHSADRPRRTVHPRGGGGTAM